ncbi:unnamed protein product, partial [Ixodes hexagonus]
VLATWVILLVSASQTGILAQRPPDEHDRGETPVVVVTGPLVRVWEPTRGSGGAPPPSTVGFPTSHHVYEEELAARERPPPVFVRAQPVPLSEPQGTGWVPMHSATGGWLSQPHPGLPQYSPTSVGPSPFVFPASRPPYQPVPQQNGQQTSVGAFARARWRGGEPAPYPPPNAIPPDTDGMMRHLADGTPSQKVSSDTNREDVRLQTPSPFPSTEPTQIRGTTDPTVPFDPATTVGIYVDAEVTTRVLAPNSSSPLRVPDYVFEQRDSRHGDATVDATVGEGVTATPNETVTPKVTRTERPAVESTGYVLAGGAVAGIVIGAVSLLALLAGLATYVFLRHPSLRLLGGRDKTSSENVAYIDDSVRSGYMNTHIELPKENSEEMTSLDNDSFLNSLEAVTIQNYWADATKNTNV